MSVSSLGLDGEREFRLSLQHSTRFRRKLSINHKHIDNAQVLVLLGRLSYLSHLESLLDEDILDNAQVLVLC